MQFRAFKNASKGVLSFFTRFKRAPRVEDTIALGTSNMRYNAKNTTGTSQSTPTTTGLCDPRLP